MNDWRQCDNKFINAHIRMLFIASMMVCLTFIKLVSAIETHKTTTMNFIFNLMSIICTHEFISFKFLFYLFILLLSL